MDIGNRLRSTRKAKGLSQERLARQADVSLNMVSRLERGEIVDPHISGLSKIADALGVSVGELLEAEPVPLGEAPPRNPSPKEVDEAGEKFHGYPYPWMGDVLARTLDHWLLDVRRRQDPKRCHIIAVSCLDVLESVLRFDVPGDKLADRVSEDEVKQRAELCELLFKLTQRAQDFYVDSKEAEPAEVQSLEERREGIRRLTREIKLGA